MKKMAAVSFIYKGGEGANPAQLFE